MYIIIIGYILFLIVGFTLGLLGGGGSILTVPVLTYILGYDAMTATYMSLFIVGSSSFVASFSGIRQGKLDYNSVIKFGLPSIASVILTRKLIVTRIPDVMYFFDYRIDKSKFLITFFIAVLILAAVYMVTPGKKQLFSKVTFVSKDALLILQGLFVGFITGMVGAGGGFLIVPALILFAGLPMKKAITTSLFIIAINTLLGFFSGLNSHDIEWKRLFILTLIAVLGTIPGVYFSSKLKENKSKIIFGYFILAIGVVMVLKEYVI